jgi:N-acetylglucosaminyldiphosphoundecaprenol N-acetyl-beta-D-mannosaminyltransferase
MTREPTGRIDILGVRVSAINMEMALEDISSWVTESAREYVCVTNVHGVMESQRDDILRRIHNEAGLVTPDGMPIVWLSRLYGYHHVTRVYGPDLMLALCARSLQACYRHYFYGGGPGIAEQLAACLQARFPGLRVVGTYSPPFRPLTLEEREDVAAKINEANPHLVWVGLGTPKQEYWMYDFRPRLTAPVLLGVGAAFDFHAGIKPQAPAILQRAGLEWLFRLCVEPRRLWRRYLRNNPLFIWKILHSLSVERARLERWR